MSSLLARALVLAWLLSALSGAEEPLVKVGHPRQLRGAWVASVANLHWPSQPGLSAQAQREELDAIVACLAEQGFNTLFFQVRPEGDALYRSELEPWSRFLSGRQGQDPGYDPLEYLIAAAHRRNLEVHAWLNPYRAQAIPPPTEGPVAPHLAVVHPSVVVPYGPLRWMNPAAEVVRERLVAVCRDLARRYDLDGLHFDDYFYPYPEGQLDFPDGGQDPEFRREQVNAAIEAVREALLEEKEYLRFGISPFGIPAPDKPAGIEGLDQYARLYADTQLWMDEGWIDYLAPQLYWPTSKLPQAFEPLLRWWSAHARDGRHIYAGLNLAALGSNPAWTIEEYRCQLELTRRHAQGFIVWNITALLARRCPDLWPARPALPPPLARVADRWVEPPVLAEGRLLHRDPVPLRSFTVYSQTGELLAVLPPGSGLTDVPEGAWAVAAVCRDGCESQGRRLP